MDDISNFKHLQKLLSPVADDAPCGEDLDDKSDEEYLRIERDAQKAKESREWKSLKKDIQKILTTTKDLRLVTLFSKTLLQTETSPIDGLAQGLYLTHEYIDKYWDCFYPSEDKDEPDEKYTDRINSIAELGSWKFLVLPLRKKCPLLSFDGLGEYFLEDLVALKNGDTLEGKQSPKNFFEGLPSNEKEQVDSSLASFEIALDLTESIKKLLSEKTGLTFIDFDNYLIPNLKDGISVLSELSPNAEEITEPNQEDTNTPVKNTSSQKNISSIQNRDDVVKLLEMICNYYTEHEPSSPLPLLLQRAKSIVHKDFLEVLEELVPDSISMTEPVFGRSEENEN